MSIFGLSFDLTAIFNFGCFYVLFEVPHQTWTWARVSKNYHFKKIKTLPQNWFVVSKNYHVALMTVWFKLKDDYGKYGPHGSTDRAQKSTLFV